MKLVLSIFAGIDLLGKAFSKNGFCVVKADDLNLDGGDIRDFKAPANRFDAVIGGSPCQDFSRLNRKPKGYSLEMQNEYIRVVREASPTWFLYENVVGFPHFEIDGYTQQRFQLDLAWFSPFSRRRDFIFGHKEGVLLNPMIRTNGATKGTAVTGSDKRSFQTMCEIQGLPKDFDLPFLSLEGKKQAVANAVPMPIGNYLAALINSTLYDIEKKESQKIEYKRCSCGCGRIVTGRQLYSGATCRKRAQRQRDKRQLQWADQMKIATGMPQIQIQNILSTYFLDEE